MYSRCADWTKISKNPSLLTALTSRPSLLFNFWGELSEIASGSDPTPKKDHIWVRFERPGCHNSQSDCEVLLFLSCSYSLEKGNENLPEKNMRAYCVGGLRSYTFISHMAQWDKSQRNNFSMNHLKTLSWNSLFFSTPEERLLLT